MARKQRKKTTTKQENGSGSIWQLPNGRFAVAVSVPGTRGKKRLKATAATYALAKVERDRLKDEAGRGVLSASTITVEQVIDLYSASKPFAENTLSTHKTAKGNLKPLLGIQMRRLTPLMISEWLACARDRMGARACEVAANVLKASCKYAVDLRLVSRTPFTISVPRAEPKEIQPFTDAEVVQIVTEAMAHPFGAVIVLAMACGMRQGEIFGLKWGDILWDVKTIRVARQVTECEGKNIQRVPKTRRSLRSFAMATVAVEALKLRLAICEAQGKAGPDDWVFATKNGNPMFRTNFYTGIWVPLLERLKIDHRGLHHGRHTTATILLSKGIPVEDVSRMLGHSRPSLTYDKYSHYRDGSGKQAADAMDSVIGCPSVAPRPAIRVHRAS
jgi:integrase